MHKFQQRRDVHYTHINEIAGIGERRVPHCSVSHANALTKFRVIRVRVIRVIRIIRVIFVIFVSAPRLTRLVDRFVMPLSLRVCVVVHS